MHTRRIPLAILTIAAAGCSRAPAPTLAPAPTTTPVPAIAPTLASPADPPAVSPEAPPARAPEVVAPPRTASAAPTTPVVPPVDPRLEAARKRVKSLQAELEKLAPRTFDHDVGVGFQSEAEFREYVLRQFEKEMPADLADGMAAAAVALGLLPEGTDLRKTLTDAFVSQALAYYDPEKDTFFVVKQGLPEAMADPAYLHELQHAIQDQRLGLDRIVKEASAPGNDDRGQAIRFLFEGEANYLMTVYAAKTQMGMDLGKPSPIADQVFRAQGDMPFSQLLRLLEMQSGMLGPEMAKTVEDMKAIPRFVIRGMVDAYNRGQWTIHEVRKAGGWEGVDTLFREPPTSTEQMLHPKEKLLGALREEPVAVGLPDLAPVLGADTRRLFENTLGENAIQILLTEQLPEAESARGTAAAAGWGGDRYVVYRKGTGRPFLAWLSVWDSEGDAKEFEASYGKAAAARNEARGWPAAAVAREGAWVAVVEGAEAEADQKVAAVLMTAAKQDR
ncbi:MAG: hypothetical protein L0216_12490 [Planctomycetales bacterium]|nr:hypothetical protein [Planctomycetales bacterium]